MSDWKRVFAIIWTGQLFSTLSSAIVGYAVVFWLSIETRSAEVLAFATIAALLPQLLLGPLTGVLIDSIGVPLAFVISGLMIVVLGTTAFFVPAIRDMIRVDKKGVSS